MNLHARTEAAVLDALAVFGGGARAGRWPDRLGVAVSGGGDSMALLCLLAEICRARGGSLRAATVDHGLRPEATHEAVFVSESCAASGIPHDTLRWQDWDGSGNLQAEARDARYRELAAWARGHGLAAVALGHTADDQAETVLMNLARGSGVDGLCGMAEATEREGVCFLRPLLGATRVELRADLEARGQEWVEDPSNDDPRFARVRARRMLDELSGIGLSRARLLDTAGRMREARAALERQAADLLDGLTLHAGDVLLPEADFMAAPREIRHRVLAAILCRLSGQRYRPRFDPLRRLADDLSAGGKGGVLHGCRITRGRHVAIAAAAPTAVLRVGREPAALEGVVATPGNDWDGRFRVTGPAQPGDEVRAFGQAAFGPLPDARDRTIPRETLAASPAVWRNGTPIAVPLAGIGSGWQVTSLLQPEDFRRPVISR